MMPSSLCFVSVGLLLLVLSQSSYAYSALCVRLCANGRGGNLCRCSAVHFAGKRTGTSYVDTSSHVSHELADPMDAYLLTKNAGRTPNKVLNREISLAGDESNLLQQLLPQLQDLRYRQEQLRKQRQLAQKATLARVLEGSPYASEDARLLTENDEVNLNTE